MSLIITLLLQLLVITLISYANLFTEILETINHIIYLTLNILLQSIWWEHTESRITT